MIKRFFLIFILIGNTLFFNSQNDSLARPYYVELNDFFSQEKKFTIEKDTVLDNQFNYFRKDFNGNYCLPSQEILPEFKTAAELGLYYYSSPYKNHVLTQKDIRFYTTKKPYTRVFGLAGQRQEQFLSLQHTHNIGNFNYSLLFGRYKNKGFYKRQLGTSDNFLGTFNYTTKNSKYQISGWLLSNQIKHEENGGIKSQENFDSLFRENKELISINLENAKRITRQINTGLIQTLNLTSRKDSSYLLKIYHNLYYKRESYLYFDENPNPGYYESIFIDSAFTRDSSTLHSFNNKIGIGGTLTKENNLDFHLSYRNEIGNIKQYATQINSNNASDYIRQRDTSFQNHFADIGINLRNQNAQVNFNSEYAFSGFYTGNYRLQLKTQFDKIFKKIRMELDFAQEKRKADLFYLNYSSNHYRWNNKFKDVTLYQMNGKLFFPGNKLWIENYSRLTRNFIWYYTPDIPLQNSESVFINRVGIGGKLKWKKMHLNASANYQYTNIPEIISLPDFHFHSQLFFEKSSEAGNSRIQVGAQLNYYSGFASNAYSPGINMFYVSGRQTCGNYPFIDFFINAEIQPVKFFILIDHINQGFTGSNYFLTPNLPMADRAIKFGFTWLFWD